LENYQNRNILTQIGSFFLEYAEGNIFPFQVFITPSMGIFFQAQFGAFLKS